MSAGDSLIISALDPLAGSVSQLRYIALYLPQSGDGAGGERVDAAAARDLDTTWQRPDLRVPEQHLLQAAGGSAQ